MGPELIIAALLSDPSLTALVGDRIATPMLPTNTAYPALAYQLVSHVPQPHLDTDEGQYATARVQITPLAVSIGQVKQIHGVVRALLDHKRGVVAAGKTVITCRLDASQQVQKDTDIGLWYQHADYLITYYE